MSDRGSSCKGNDNEQQRFTESPHRMRLRKRAMRRVTSVSLIKSKTADRDVIQHATWRLSCAQFLGGPTRPYYGCIHATDDRYAVITPPLAPAGRSILLRKAHAQSEVKAGDVVTNLRTRRAFLMSEAVPGYCFSSSVKHFAFLARSM